MCRLPRKRRRAMNKTKEPYECLRCASFENCQYAPENPGNCHAFIKKEEEKKI